jgi:outer membrane protein assembly factor BamB
VYFGGQDGHVYGYAPRGERLFDVDVGGPVDSYPALTADGVLVVGSRNGVLTAIA